MAEDQLSSRQIEDLLKTINVSNDPTQPVYPICENCKEPTKRVIFETPLPCKISVIDYNDKKIWKGMVHEKEIICLACGAKYIFTTQFKKDAKNNRLSNFI